MTSGEILELRKPYDAQDAGGDCGSLVRKRGV